MHRFAGVIALVVAAAAPLLLGGAAQAQTPVAWRAGTALRQALEESVGPVGVAWSGVPLRQVLTQLGREKRVAIHLDRRIDPGRLVSLALRDVSLLEAIANIARTADAEVGQIGSVVYVGPASISRRLRTVAELRMEEARRLPTGLRTHYLRSAACAWDDLTAPRDLIAEFATEVGVRMEGIEQVPHDLWPAAELAPLAPVERLTLVLAGFDLTYEMHDGGERLVLVPIPERVAIQRSYSLAGLPEDTVEKLERRLPDAELRVAGGRLLARGTVEEHASIADALSGRATSRETLKPAKPVPLSRVRIEKFTAVNQPVGNLVEMMAERLQLELKMDRAAIQAAGIDLGRPVTVKLDQGSVGELLDAITREAGLVWRLEERTLHVTSAE